MVLRRRRGPVVVGPIQPASVAGCQRVSAEVDGIPVWFESSDTALRAAPEALCSAFLLPALHQGTHLESVLPLDPVWLANVDRLLKVLRRWWRYPRHAPRAPGAAVPTAGKAEPAGQSTGPPDFAPTIGPDRGTAGTSGVVLFFSGGVDSFYSLLRGNESPDGLVTVQGFDVGLEDRARMSAVEATLREVCDARHLRAIRVRTNLREHPLMQTAPWERSHGGALAAVGHVLGDGVSEVLISSSIARSRKRAWGSHWKTDPLFSSSRVRFRQVGTELRRAEKVRWIAQEALVLRNLRVCWENRSPSGNCSCCGKCLLTRLLLAECGALDACSTLAGSATLVRDLDALPSVRGSLIALGRLAASPSLAPDVLRATRALLRRSRHAQSMVVRARRALLRRLLEWGGGGRS